MTEHSTHRRRISVGPGTADAIRLLIEDRFGPCYWDGFQAYMTQDSEFPKEWRCGGVLGFGGKVHYDGRRLYVGCYPEELRDDPFLASEILEANRALEELLTRA